MRDPKHRLSPSAVKLGMIVGGLVALVATGIVALLSVLFDLPGWLPYAGAATAFSIAVVVPPLRYRRWRYEIRSHDLYFSRGALWLVRSLVPFDRIQYVESRQGPLDRIFDLHELVVYTWAGRARFPDSKRTKPRGCATSCPRLPGRSPSDRVSRVARPAVRGPGS